MGPRRHAALLLAVSVAALGTLVAACDGSSSADDQAVATSTTTVATGPRTGPSATGGGAGPSTTAPVATATTAARPVPVLRPVPATKGPTAVAYDVTGTYPQLDGLPAGVATTVNDALAARARSVVTSFEHDLTDLVGNVPDEPGVQSGIDLAPSAPLLTAQLASIRLDVLRVFEGAAHPDSQIVAANFDLVTGRELALADLFVAGQPYLQEVADLATAALTQQLDELGFGPPDPFGTAPSLDNYRAWWLTVDGLLIGFPAGQAGAYALGNQMVSIPWSDLRRLLSPTGPASLLVE